MLIPDVNVLIYATDRKSPKHASAQAWLNSALNSDMSLGFAWTVMLAFVRLVTKPLLFEKPLKTNAAVDVVDSWLESPASIIIHPGDRHATILRSLLTSLGTAGNLTTDAHLAALAIEHGATVITYDREFGRFPGVRHHEPR